MIVFPNTERFHAGFEGGFNQSNPMPTLIAGSRLRCKERKQITSRLHQ